MLHVHGFDWKVYAEQVMPAFAHWLLNEDEAPIVTLYEQTRRAQEERFMPPAMQHLCDWPRAQMFVQQLLRGSHTLREYEVISSAEKFTAFSDNYIHRHPPQLYQDSAALRAVWGAIVETFCSVDLSNSLAMADTAETARSEMVSLLHTAGLKDLAQVVDEQLSPSDKPAGTSMNDEEMADTGYPEIQQRGILIGRYPTILHLRGWIAAASVRGMALFELLACGRRSMPFGFKAGEAFVSYIGYLTPDEVWQMFLCVQRMHAPDPQEAAKDYQRFRNQQSSESFRMIDEVLPDCAASFLLATSLAAQRGLGLLCSVD